MNDEIQLISDGDGLAVIGEREAVERFLDSVELTSTELDLPSLWDVLGISGALAQAGGVVAASAGRWLQLTPESAELLSRLHPVANSASGLLIGVVRGDNGQFQKMLEFTSAGTTLLNPAAIAGVGALITQMALMKKIDEISDYLAVIDEKVDEILRAHKDAVIADLVGMDLVIQEAMTIREQVGRVSEIVWGKVQYASAVIGRTQVYALRQLDALADGVERVTDVDKLAKVATVAEARARDWIAVLAHSFRLQEAVAVLELDRVLDAAPQDLDQHRLGLKLAREHRLQLISKSTAHLMARMASVASRANKWVLLNPVNSPIVVHANNAVAAKIVGFHEVLGIDRGDESVQARRWSGAVGDLKNGAVEKGREGVELGARFGGRAIDRARSVTNKVAIGIAERTQSRQDDVEES